MHALPISRSRLFPLLLLSVAAACSGGSSSTPGGATGAGTVRELLAAGGAPAPVEVAAFARGPADLVIEIEGGAAARVVVEADRGGEGGHTSTTVESRADELVVSLPLDAGETRAVRARIELLGEGAVRRVALKGPEPEGHEPRGPEGGRDPGPLEGALAGRDLILFVADSLHAAHLSSYGAERETSPMLDALARGGVRFDTAYSQTAWTLASMTSLFTSLEQERHGVQRMDNQLDAGFTTLAELLAAEGYRTAALVQNGVVRPSTGLGQGFESYEVLPYEAHGTDQLIQRARAVLAESRAEGEGRRPLFLYLHLTPPHMPYQPPEPHASLFTDEDYAGEVDGSIVSCGLIDRDKPPREGDDVRHLEALYDGHIHFADARMGGLVQELLDDGGGPRLAVVVTSDHGEAFLQHGKQGHNAQVFEEMVRVPLILFAPGSALPAGHVEPEPVILTDVLPTLAELFALGVPSQGFGGRSLTRLLVDEPPPDFARPFFLTSRYPAGEPFERVHLGVRMGDYKLLLRRGTAQLYDLARDPGETEDLSEARPVLAAAMRATLERWWHAASAEGARAGSVPISEEVAEDLRGLGYMGGEEEED